MRTRRALIIVVLAVMLAVPATTRALPSIPSSKFESSNSCGCHASLYTQWTESMHAKAITDPLYLLKLKEAEEATDGALGPFCTMCHAPVAAMAGELTGSDQSNMSAVGREGVTCSFCHQVIGTEGPLGNASVAITGDGIRRAQLKDPQAPHAAEYSAFHETAEFCGNCHNVDHPGNGMHLEATYTEWKNGPYAAQGIVCQDCHMTPGPGVTKPNPGKAAGMGPDREHIYTMTFAGGNVGLGDAVLAEERLKAAAEIDLELPEIVASGDVALKTTITNVGAGHYLPTGLTEVRQMWLEVSAIDESGRELLRERRDFGSILRDEAGNSPVELWDAVAFESDDRIPPKESVSNEYSFPMAGDAVIVEATLYYRSCSEEMAEKAGVEIPTTTMVTAKQTVYASAEAKEAGAGDGGVGEGETDESPRRSMAWLYILAAAVAVGTVLFLMFRRDRQ